MSDAHAPPQGSETANERFERLAAEFYAETGMMAPGKDDVLGTHDYDMRWSAWRRWLAARRPASPSPSAPSAPAGETTSGETCPRLSACFSHDCTCHPAPPSSASSASDSPPSICQHPQSADTSAPAPSEAGIDRCSAMLLCELRADHGVDHKVTVGDTVVRWGGVARVAPSAPGGGDDADLTPHERDLLNMLHDDWWEERDAEGYAKLEIRADHAVLFRTLAERALRASPPGEGTADTEDGR